MLQRLGKKADVPHLSSILLMMTFNLGIIEIGHRDSDAGSLRLIPRTPEMVYED